MTVFTKLDWEGLTALIRGTGLDWSLCQATEQDRWLGCRTRRATWRSVSPSGKLQHAPWVCLTGSDHQCVWWGQRSWCLCSECLWFPRCLEGHACRQAVVMGLFGLKEHSCPSVV